MEEQGSTTMWFEPENDNETHDSHAGSKLGWFLLGLGLGAGVMLVAVNREQAKTIAGLAASKVKLKVKPNML
jgi:hypothetical protein